MTFLKENQPMQSSQSLFYEGCYELRVVMHIFRFMCILQKFVPVKLSYTHEKRSSLNKMFDLLEMLEICK